MSKTRTVCCRRCIYRNILNILLRVHFIVNEFFLECYGLLQLRPILLCHYAEKYMAVNFSCKAVGNGVSLRIEDCRDKKPRKYSEKHPRKNHR